MALQEQRPCSMHEIVGGKIPVSYACVASKIHQQCCCHDCRWSNCFASARRIESCGKCRSERTPPVCFDLALWESGEREGAPGSARGWFVARRSRKGNFRCRR